ncbi:protein SAR DEFICIENT 1-like [Hibiscus syriacus]|uniref:protein SAR DEFICIENT 1-like n=1 Tax=Hibiscus syriacus TaxID=106335 RepID=UPI001924A815|nr:protein SAR DEFICIENT 1-like [Hibiscus syriacus]
MMLPCKRTAPDHGDDDDESLELRAPEPKRRANLKHAVRSIMGVGGLSFNKIVLNLEPMLRLWVREAVERAIMSSIPSSSRSSLNQIEAPRGRRLQLHFVDKLPSIIFTGSKVEAENGNTIRIVIVDATTQTMVSSLSSVKVEIVVLNGDFDANERQDWSENQFNASVLREREGRRPLVTGDVNFTMVDGVGTVDNVVFTDNSSWIRSRKFRLGARIVQQIAGEVTIREAISEAFMVKDHRGELYKKHYPPHQRDEVWRLERIAKDGAFHARLASKNIHNIKDFLRLQVTDPSTLRNILGGGISNRVWDTIIEHALTCVLDDDEWYTYYGAAQRVGLLLNSIYQVIEVTFDGQNYLPVENLNFSQKLLVEDAKRQAYKNVRDLVLIDRRAITAGPSMLFTDLLPEQVGTSNLLLPQPYFSASNQDQQDMSLGFNQSSASYAYEVEDPNNLQGIGAFNPMLRNSFRMEGIFPYNGDNSFSLFADEDFNINQDNPQTQMLSLTSAAPTWAQGNGFILTPDYESSSIGILASSPSFNVHNRSIREARDVCPKAQWLKLRAVIQWRSIRRGAARRRHWLPQGICI